jgi:hypothetical protein
VVIAIRSTIDISQRNGLPEAAATLVLSDATLASCTSLALPEARRS